MALNEVQFAAAKARLEAVWKNSDCPVCTSRKWMVDGIVHLDHSMSAFLRVAGTTAPYVTVTCSVCGYTMFLNAKVLGVVHD